MLFEVLTTANEGITFWNIMLCSLVIYRRLRDDCCLHLQGPDEGASAPWWLS